MLPDRRIFQRFEIILALEIKRPDEEGTYYYGITKNFSYDGFCIETQCLAFEQGENLEVKVKHPHNDVTVTMLGEVSWKKKSDKFACSMGIKLSELDLENKMRILEIMSASGGIPVDSFLVEEVEHEKEEEEREGQNIELHTEQEDVFMPEIVSSDVEHREFEDQEENDIYRTEKIVAEEQEPERPAADESSLQGHPESGETGYAGDDEKAESHINEHEVNALQKELDEAGDDNAAAEEKRRDKKRIYIVIVIVIAAALSYAVPLLFKQFNNGSKSPATVSQKSAGQQEKKDDLIIPSIDKDRANEFPFNRLQQSPVSQKSADQQEKKDDLIIPSLDKDRVNEFRSKRLKQTGEQPMVKDTGSNKLEQKAVTAIQKPLVKAKTKGRKEFYIQVGAWRNEVYAKAMLAKLKKRYPDARIIVVDKFHKVRIPGIVSETRGKEILKDIEAKFQTRALLVVKK